MATKKTTKSKKNQTIKDGFVFTESLSLPLLLLSLLLIPTVWLLNFSLTSEIILKIVVTYLLVALSLISYLIYSKK